MPEPFVTRSELERSVEQVMTNVVLHVGMAEKTTSAKIDGLRSSVRWQVLAGLGLGQTAAAIAATYMTGNGQRVEQVAAVLLPWL